MGRIMPRWACQKYAAMGGGESYHDELQQVLGENKLPAGRFGAARLLLGKIFALA